MLNGIPLSTMELTSAIPLKSTLLKGASVNLIFYSKALKWMMSNGTSMNSILYWMKPHWIQCHWTKHQWIKCYIEWSSTVNTMPLSGKSMNSMLYWMESHYEHNGSKWNISEFNAILIGISLQSMLCNGVEWNPTEAYVMMWNPSEFDVVLNEISLNWIFYWMESNCIHYYIQQHPT